MEFAGVKLSERIAFVCILIPFLAILAILAARGEVAAIILLAVIGTTTLLVIGGLGVLLAMNVYNKWQSARFTENMQENLSMMALQQRVQNQLTTGTLNYAQGMQRLLREPNQLPTKPPWELIDVDEGILRQEPGAWDTDIGGM